jgi:hypothetical protein
VEVPFNFSDWGLPQRKAQLDKLNQGRKDFAGLKGQAAPFAEFVKLSVYHFKIFVIVGHDIQDKHTNEFITLH